MSLKLVHQARGRGLFECPIQSPRKPQVTSSPSSQWLHHTLKLRKHKDCLSENDDDIFELYERRPLRRKFGRFGQKLLQGCKDELGVIHLGL